MQMQMGTPDSGEAFLLGKEITAVITLILTSIFYCDGLHRGKEVSIRQGLDKVKLFSISLYQLCIGDIYMVGTLTCVDADMLY